MNTDIYNLTAGDLMTPWADTVGPREPLQHAIEKLVALEVSALPVVSESGQCVGVISKTDIVKWAGDQALVDGAGEMPRGREIPNVSVASRMTQHVLHVSPETLVPVVAEKMLLHEVHHLPVCDASKQVLGMISGMDLVKAIHTTATQAAACRAVSIERPRSRVE